MVLTITLPVSGVCSGVWPSLPLGFIALAIQFGIYGPLMRETAEASAALSQVSAISPEAVDLYNRCLDKDLEYMDIIGQVGESRQILADQVKTLNTLFILFYWGWVVGTSITGVMFLMIFLGTCC